MSATKNDYIKLFGKIKNGTAFAAKCACVACNSCTCACSCRKRVALEEIEW